MLFTSHRQLPNFLRVKTALLAIGFLLTLPLLAHAHDVITPAEQKNIEQIIENYLMSHPDKLGQVLDNMQDYYRDLSDQKQKEVLKSNHGKLVNDPRDMRIGPKNAKHVVVEFYDYNCSYCRKNYPDIRKLLDTRQDILFIFKELPILAETSIEAAQLALTIKDPSQFKAYHAYLMQKSGRLTSNDIVEAAQAAGVNAATALAASKDEKIRSHISDNNELASAIGVGGTPSFYINGELHEGYLSGEELAKLLPK
jgi:protein-disulfide isomerase